MATRYSRAAAFERKVRDDMSRRGYIAVRSPASKSPVDVYCIGYDAKVFVQCKTNGVMGPSEWNEFYDMCRSVDAIPVLAMRGKGNRGIRYMLLTDKKVPRRRQPMVEWVPREGGRVEVLGASS